MIISEIKIMFEKEKENYINFWKNFGSVIKEGLYEFNEYHDKILDLLRFQTSENNNYLSLQDYVDCMHKDQKEIYYFANVDKNHVKNSPQLELFKDKKIPVIYMTDAVDDFWLQNIGKYKKDDLFEIHKDKNIPDKK